MYFTDGNKENRDFDLIWSLHLKSVKLLNKSKTIYIAVLYSPILDRLFCCHSSLLEILVTQTIIIEIILYLIL